MKNNSIKVNDFKQKLNKKQLLAKLALKNLKGGGDIGCPPPTGIAK